MEKQIGSREQLEKDKLTLIEQLEKVIDNAPEGFLTKGYKASEKVEVTGAFMVEMINLLQAQTRQMSQLMLFQSNLENYNIRLSTVVLNQHAENDRRGLTTEVAETINPEIITN